jgi:hypothetical protein
MLRQYTADPSGRPSRFLPAAPPVEAALDDVRACEVAGYDTAVKELRRRLEAADAETPGSDAHAWIERFATVTTRMYYQKVTRESAFGPL